MIITDRDVIVFCSLMALCCVGILAYYGSMWLKVRKLKANLERVIK